MGRRTNRRAALAIGVLVTGLVAAGPPPAHRCQRQSVEVTVPSGEPAIVATWLCWRGRLATQPVQVTVPGTTYTHAYWDFPLQPDRYSYARHMTGAGYAVLTYDRVGTGASTVPDDFTTVTFDMHVDVLHQLVAGLREGRFATHRFETVVTVGHSQGAFIANIEAARHQDVDAVISTGVLHGVNPLVGPHAKNLFWPAQFDPALGDRAPLGYATTPPGTRGPAFYHQPNADPRVIAEDERRKSIASYAELSMAAAMAPYAGLDAPVLSVVGNRDALFCPLGDCTGYATLGTEALLWPDAACFDLTFLPETGHDINLHRDARAWFALAVDWLDAVLDQGC